MKNFASIANTKSILMQEGEEIQTLLATNKSATGIKYDNVYVTPSYIKFDEAFEGVTYQQRITIKNVGNRPAFIRIRQSNSLAFQVKTLTSGMRVSPGLSIKTCVTYTFKRPSVLHAIIPIEINGKVFNYRAICTLATEHISIEPTSIDFGTIDIGYSSGLKILTIHNEGSKSTRFSIDLGQNDLDIIVKPLHGRIKPQKEVKLQIELIGGNEGVFYNEFWIKSTPNIRVPIKVHIIIPKLVIYHPNTTGDITLIDFPPTIENTSRCDTFVLRNLSSRVSSYVVLGEVDNEVKCIRDIDRKNNPIYSVFEICPLEGRMNPFQGIIFEVKFSPITMLSQWRQKHEQKQRKGSENEHQSRENRDFMAFIRIVKVHCVEREMEDNIRIDFVRNSATDNNTLSQRIYIQESMMETPSLSSCASNINSETCDIIRLCLYGEAETVQLHFEPDSLYFGDLIVGQLSQRVLRLTNPSTIAPIYVECVPSATAFCCPSRVKLKLNTSIEILIKVRGKESIQPSFKLLFNVIADSHDLTESRRCFERMRVGSYSVKCTVNIIFKSKKLLNKRNLPTCTHTKINDDEEIMKRLFPLPKWKLLYKNYSKIIDKYAECLKRCSLKKSISTIKAAVLIPLSPVQIYNVHIFPTTFAFGMVAPNSFNYQRLVVKNTNNIPVMIRLMNVSTKYVRFPEGNLMILQPDSMATRLVEYLADGLGKFNGYINYMINDNHFFELSITANVVRKQLYIDKREIELGKEWSSEEAYRPMASVIRITNKLDAKIYFRWEIPAASGFYIEPKSGSVRGNAILHAYAHYESNNAKTNSVQAIMICESGSCVSLRLNVPRFVPRVEFVNDSTNLGEIPLNLPTKMIAVLQNFEFNEMAYEIDSASLIRGCDVNPLQGKISPRGIVILEVCLTFDVCCCFSIAIAVTIQGCLRLLYRINGTVLFPRLKILPQQIDIKRVSIDAFQIHQITATNIGTTTLRLQILLEEYPEFRVFLTANNKDSEIGTEGIIIVPGASQNLYLHFQPVDLASYAFYLPIMINQLLGPVSTLNSKSIKPSEFLKSRNTHYEHLSGFTMTPLPEKLSLPTIFIDCTVVGRVVFFSKLMFQFNSATNKVSEEFSIENRITLRNIVISINIEKFSEADCPFTIEWSRGAEIKRTFDSIDCILCPGGSVFFLLEFKPRKRGSFSVEAPIYVRGELDDGMFNKLRLDGEFLASSIDVEPTKIYFTPVPLGTAIEEKFRIRARHFYNATFIRSNFSMTSRCCGDNKDDLLRIEFPNGNIISPQPYVELEARIIFKSDQPISFCSTIKFWDNHEHTVCFLTVYATADNNLLTTYIYPMKSSIFDEACATARYLEEHISYSLDSITDENDHNDEEILSTRRRSKSNIISHFDNRSRSFIQKNNKYNLHGNEDISTNNDRINKNMQVTGKRAADDEEYDDVEVLICKRHSTFPINFGVSNRKHSEKLLHPYYSINDQNSDYEKYVQRIMMIMEEWIYSGPLKFHFYPNISHGIMAAFSNFCVKKKSCVRNSKQKSKATMPSFIDVLESLAGSDIRKYLGELLKQPLPENDIKRINHVLQLYDKMLDFLLSQGAYLIHVSAQYLLNYNDYLISIDIIQNNTHKKKFSDMSRTEIHCERLSQQLFESRNKQCWLDVILQTYKCFVLRGIHEHKFDTLSSFAARSSGRSTMNLGLIVSTSSLPRQYELHDRAIWNIINLPSDKPTSDNRCPEERFLLSWLQYHYEQQRVRDWMTDRRVILNPRERQDVAEHRTIQNFHRDLSDSLVLIAVTVAYCPFLVDEYFGNLYICTRNKKEELHNAICLITAWRKIRLGFMITPMQLVNPNQVQMLMLVVYLFQTLPTYVPHAKIKFSCPLYHTITKRLSVSNRTNNTVNYLLSFVNNTNRFFIVLKPVSILRLNAHDSGQIQIQFHARKIRKSRAYLLLCGYAVGSHFGRNQTIVLEGHIDNLGISNEYTIQSKLYEIVDTSLRINIPYPNTAEYDIWMTEERPSHPSNLKMTRWCELRARKIPRRLFLNQKSIVVTEGVSEAHLSISIACIAPEKRTFWLIFQAKTGDFIIQINSVWQASINDHIVVEWTSQGECICSGQQSRIKNSCPFNINIFIPSRNAQLWKCVAEMFQKTLESKERQFWSKYLDTYNELRLIRWLMGNDIDSAALEFLHIFNTTVTYKVTISDKSSPLVVPECFTIQDVRPPYQQVPMSIHILPTTPPLYETTITLTSLDSKELRVYTIDCLRS